MKVKNLSFRHTKQAPYFFKDLSFELEAGVIHALHGKNGIGKSVLLHILGNQLEKEAVVTGELVVEKVALVNQRFDQTVVDRFTFLENIQFGALDRFPNPFCRLKKLPSLMKRGVLTLIERFNIDLTIPVFKLSGGQRQILALLMKLERETKTLLLDEPTAALDEKNASMVFEFLKTLKGYTILVVCHDQALINRYTTGKHLHLEIDSQFLRTLKQLT